MTKTSVAGREFQMSTTQLVKKRFSYINIALGFIEFQAIVSGSR